MKKIIYQAYDEKTGITHDFCELKGRYYKIEFGDNLGSFKELQIVEEFESLEDLEDDISKMREQKLYVIKLEHCL